MMESQAHQPRRIADVGLDLIKSFEGLRLRAYKDSAGIWTIGYGHTGSIDGSPVVPGMRVNVDRAEDLLSADVGIAEVAVTESVEVQLNDNQFAALVSFAFNVGAGAFKRSTMLRKLNAGDYTGAADQFQRWNKAGGRTVRGLTRRRAAERLLFVTRTDEAAELIVEREQESAAYQDPPIKSKRVGAAAAGIVSLIAVALPMLGIDVSEADLTDTSDAMIVAIQAGSAAMAALLALWSKASDQRQAR